MGFTLDDSTSHVMAFVEGALPTMEERRANTKGSDTQADHGDDTDRFSAKEL